MCTLMDDLVKEEAERARNAEKYATAKRLLDIGILSVEQIAAGTGLPVGEIKALASA